MGRDRKFVLDSMLGNLVTWLRILGYDTVYWDGEDRGLIEVARKEGRVVLTKDREVVRLSEKLSVPVYEVKSDDVSEALACLARSLGIEIEFDGSCTRCPICNTLLREGGSRWRCDGCGKEYWIGGHWKGISKRLDEVKRLFYSGSEL